MTTAELRLLSVFCLKDVTDAVEELGVALLGIRRHGGYEGP